MHCIIFQQGYHLHSYYERYMTDKETNLYTSNFESKKLDVHSIHRVFREESTILWGSVPYVKLHRYKETYLYPRLNGYYNNDIVSCKQ